MVSRRKLAGVGLCLALAGPSAIAAGCSRPIRTPALQWVPYFYRDADGRVTGADFEIIQAVLAEAGCNLQVTAEVPRKRRYAMYAAGELDLIPGASDTPERRLHSWFTRPYRMETVGLFTLPQRAAALHDIDGFEALLQRRVRLLALNAGWFGAGYEGFRERFEGERLVTQFETFTQGLNMLAHDRGDVIMADQATLLNEARQIAMPLAALPFRASSAPVHMMLNKATITEADLRRINAALERLEARGALQRLRARYGVL